jgi:hypothetical protein
VIAVTVEPKMRKQVFFPKIFSQFFPNVAIDGVQLLRSSLPNINMTWLTRTDGVIGNLKLIFASSCPTAPYTDATFFKITSSVNDSFTQPTVDMVPFALAM